MKVYSNEDIIKNNKIVDIITTVIKVIITLIAVPILFVNTVLLVKAIANPNKTPDIFGFKTFVVASGSMEPEICTGDMILADNRRVANVGDIVTYMDNELNELITHRVVRIFEENGITKYAVKGDNNSDIDRTFVDTNNLEGVYVFNLHGAGKFIIILQNPFVLVAIILILIAFYANTKEIEERRIIRRQKRISYESKNK